ncbi:MAG TPA: nicotinate-nucleotide--dimethylbenzimidazole phosphoribosyltransferase [Desulfobacterales bacterium]
MNQEMPTLEQIAARIQPLESRWLEEARRRTAQLIMPPRALGRLHDIAERICAIQCSLKPDISSRAVMVMAADHGIASEGVSAFPQEVTGEMIRAFLTGGAGINVLAALVNAEIVVVDVGIIPELDPVALNAGHRLRVHKAGNGTANIARGPAMTEQQALACLQTGYAVASDLIQNGARLLGTGDMGIGNTTASAAVGAVITGADLPSMVGRGTGIDDHRLKHKIEMIRTAIAVNRPDPADGLDVLAKVGGFEIGGIAGCILAAAAHRVPVVVDGFISTAGALVAHALCPTSVEYMFAGHRSEESGHGGMLNYLGLQPILDLGMRLGEGTGGALAMSILEGAVRIFNRMHTFKEAGVSQG